MSAFERFLIASAVLAGGVLVGLLIRRLRAHTATATREPTPELPAGIVLVTAPHCTRCANLRKRLDDQGLRVKTVDAASNPALLERTGITTAPTLLAVDSTGRVIERESRDFSDQRLRALLDTATSSAGERSASGESDQVALGVAEE